MPFTLEQRYKVVNHLNLALKRNQTLKEEASDYYVPGLNLTRQTKIKQYQEHDIFNLLAQVEDKSEYLVIEVIKLLVELDETDELIKTAIRKSGLTKADKLELAPGQLLAALYGRQDDLILRLRHYLDLPEPPQDEGYYQAALGRS